MSLMLNDLGIDPNEWFDNPLDRMPIATDNYIENDGSTGPLVPPPNRYAPPDRLAELELEIKSMENPRPEEDIAGWFKDETEPLDIPIEETLHQKTYDIATSKYNPFAVGGSESIHDFQGGSENVT